MSAVHLSPADIEIILYARREQTLTARALHPTRGAQKLTGESLKVVWAEFSTLS